MKWYEPRLSFPVDARDVCVRRENGCWVVETRIHREGGTWEPAERYTGLTRDEAVDVAFAVLGVWD